MTCDRQRRCKVDLPTESNPVIIIKELPEKVQSFLCFKSNRTESLFTPERCQASDCQCSPQVPKSPQNAQGNTLTSESERRLSQEKCPDCTASSVGSAHGNMIFF